MAARRMVNADGIWPTLRLFATSWAAGFVFLLCYLG